MRKKIIKDGFFTSLRMTRRWIPAFAGMTCRWIPAFAGMTPVNIF